MTDECLVDVQYDGRLLKKNDTKPNRKMVSKKDGTTTTTESP